MPRGQAESPSGGPRSDKVLLFPYFADASKNRQEAAIQGQKKRKKKTEIAADPSGAGLERSENRSESTACAKTKAAEGGSSFWPEITTALQSGSCWITAFINSPAGPPAELNNCRGVPLPKVGGSL